MKRSTSMGAALEQMNAFQAQDNRRRGFTAYLRTIGGTVYRYGNASHGLKDILLYLRAVRRQAAPNIVMPSFIPAKLYRAVLAAGYEIKFYEIEEGCRFDPNMVERLIDGNTAAILLIHYFGHPSNIRAMRTISQHRHVTLIEDCAHSLLGMVDGKPLGTFGDCAMFSPRKMLQLSDGGLLLLNNDFPGFLPTYTGRVRSAYTSSRLILTRTKRVYFGLLFGKDVLHLAHAPQIGYLDPLRKPEIHVRRMSFVTSLYERAADLERQARIRRRNYYLLYSGLARYEFLKPVFDDLPETWTPFSFPMILRYGSRSNLQAELLAKGISCGLGWPEAPFGIRHWRTRDLSHRIIEFPVHPLLLERQLERIVEGCASYETNHLRKSSHHLAGNF